MARYGKRRRAAEPRVDDFFYDNPQGADGVIDDAASGAGPERDNGLSPAAPEPLADAAGDSEPDPVAPDGRRPRRAVGRWVRALAIAGAAGLLVAAAASGDVHSVSLADALGRAETAPRAPTQTAGAAVISQGSLACVGPGLVGLDDPTVPEPEQSVSAYAGSAPVEALPEGISPAGAGELTLVAIPEGETKQTDARGDLARLAMSGPTWARGIATGSLAAGFAASQIGLDLQEQQRGLSTAPCWPAQEDTWLLGGGGQPGRVERLILVNPTGNPVTADVKVLGAQGPFAAAGGRGIVVPPAGRHVVLLDALAPGEKRPVVHVSSTGGPLVAALGDRWLAGTLDRGLELTTASASPATDLVIPALLSPRSDSADTAFVRVGVPGEEVAIVQLRALTADGPVRVAHDVTNIEAGAVADIDVSDLPRGTYAIEVVADTPVVASGYVERRVDAEAVSDLAWVPAVEPSSGLVGAPLASRGKHDFRRRLSLASLEGAQVDVITVSGDAVRTAQMEVPAAGHQSVKLDLGTDSVWVRVNDGSASAAVITTVSDDLGTLVAGMALPEVSVTRQVRAVAPWLP